MIRRTGDTVAIVCPASAPRQEPIERATWRLHEFGLRTKTYRDIHASHGYLAGSDAERADEFMTALADPEVAAILPARGGYGVSRILDQLDYAVIAKNPKLLVGFSDITALHHAIHVHTGLVTYHGPNVQEGLGAPEGLNGLARETYLRVLLGPSKTDSSVSSPQRLSNELLVSGRYEPMCAVRSGEATGPLIGGNLAVLCGLVGTPYCCPLDHCILLLEDVSERPYRVDRYLSQLRAMGALAQVAGVAIGQFNECTPEPGKPSLSIDQVFVDYFGDLGVPWVTGLPCGHAGPNVTLPFGAPVTLRADVQSQSVELAFAE